MKTSCDGWKTAPGKCVNCDKCRIYVEGPSKGRCIYGGPFSGYRYDKTHPNYRTESRKYGATIAVRA